MDKRVILNGELAINIVTRRFLMALRLLTGKTDAAVVAQLLDMTTECFIEWGNLNDSASVTDMENALRKLSEKLYVR